MKSASTIRGQKRNARLKALNLRRISYWGDDKAHAEYKASQKRAIKRSKNNYGE